MDINTVRKDTRGCADKIFLNSAGSSLVPAVVTDRMVAYLQEEGQIGGYALANSSAEELQGFYTEAAVLLNCAPENIAFTTSATDGYAKAISSVKFRRGDVILTTDDDYISNQLSFLSLKDRSGITVIRVANGADGSLDLDTFKLLVIKYQPKLVALTHVPTSSGLVQPAIEVGQICRKYDVLYLLDACQSVGQLVVDVQQIGCDFLTATGRKFLRGPRGTGILYVSDRVLDTEMVPLIFDMQAAKWSGFDSYELVKTAARFEFWEASAAGKLGLATALHYANTIGMPAIEAYNADLMGRFRARLKEVKGLQLHDKGKKLSNILTFTIENKTIEELCRVLNDHHIYYSLSYKDFALIDFTKKNLERAIRFSPHYFNTAEELEKVVAILSY